MYSTHFYCILHILNCIINFILSFYCILQFLLYFTGFLMVLCIYYCVLVYIILYSFHIITAFILLIYIAVTESIICYGFTTSFDNLFVNLRSQLQALIRGAGKIIAPIFSPGDIWERQTTSFIKSMSCLQAERTEGTGYQTVS